MKLKCLLLGVFVAFCAAATTAPSPEAAPATRPAPAATDLLGPKFVSQIYGIEFRQPAQCVQIDRPTPDTIVEFDRDDYNWRLKAWRVRLERSLPLTVHKDQFGTDQDGVLEVTLHNIRQQTPDVQVLRNEVINVGRVRVGMIGVRYQTATHERRFTQQAIFEAPDADSRLYYFFDLTGPGKPIGEPDDIVNPIEKLAYDTFSQLIDSVVLLDRSKIEEDKKERLISTLGLFLDWNSDDRRMIKSALIPDQYQRIIKDGQDIGYQYIVEEYQPNAKAPEMSGVRVGIRSRMMPTPLAQWDTETWMTSSADRKHEHFETVARCTNNKGELVDSFSQVGASDEQTKAIAAQPSPDVNGSLLPPRQNGPDRGSGSANIDIVTVRSLVATTTHRTVQLSPFKVDVPVFYVPQAFSYLLPSLVPLQPRTYMFATFVPSTPQTGSVSSGGNVMARYIDVLSAQHVRFRGQELEAIPVLDKITLEGTVTTLYFSPQAKFLGSTSTFTNGDQTSTVEIVPTDVDTLQHLWNRPDLSRPAEQPASVVPAP